MNEILTSYLPSLLILVMCYMTNFFKPFFFEAIVTVNLTAQLVLTTLFISVSGTNIRNFATPPHSFYSNIILQKGDEFYSPQSVCAQYTVCSFPQLPESLSIFHDLLFNCLHFLQNLLLSVKVFFKLTYYLKGVLAKNKGGIRPKSKKYRW